MNIQHMKRLGVFALVLVALLFSANLAFAQPIQISRTEREALIALYNSTDGDNWTDNSGWKAEPLANDGFAMPGTENTWHGIYTTESNTNVIYIVLENNQLSGLIPTEIENLTNLEYLYLRYNQLTGSIPSEMGNLTKLIRIYLLNNQLSGSIPKELANLTKLQILVLSENHLTGPIPSELGTLTNLQGVALNDNQLTGPIPPELGNLTDLLFLILDNNQLTGSIPPELENLTNLYSLDLSYNHLYATDQYLRDFLENLQPGWEDTQTHPLPWLQLLLDD